MQRLNGKSSVNNRMNCTYYCTDKHRNYYFRNSSHINCNAVPLLYTKTSENIGKPAGFSPQSKIGECTEVAVFTFPYKSEFVAAVCFYMNIEAVIGNICFAADKPFIKRFVRIIKNFIPFLKPMKVFSFSCPKCQVVFLSKRIKFIAFCICIFYYFGGGIKNFAM